MEAMMVLLELSIILDVAGVAIGLPVLLVLGGITLAGTLSSRRAAFRETGGSGIAPPETTPCARPSRILALSVVALGCALGAMGAGAVLIAVPEGVWGTLFGWTMITGMSLLNLLLSALVILLAVVTRDVVGRRFVAGRDTWTAYAVMVAADAGLWAVALASGVFDKLAA